MKAMNLYALTRTGENKGFSKDGFSKDSFAVEDFSRLAQALSGRAWYRTYSPHEAASLCALVDSLARCYRKESGDGGERPAAEAEDWICFFDGFWFSYTIEHISKEFDLLKVSDDGDCILNIELKSESIEEDRIRRQLEQNRYYLSHISRTILSYTYVMEEDALYCLNDHGYLKKCLMEELAQALKRTALQHYVEEDLRRFFRAQDYLISPVRTPEKFLSGRYFLTNQQADFRRQILEALEVYAKEKREAPGLHAPVISLTGSAGTGKTLLLFDLARELSRKRRRRVLFLHGGPLREGHRVIDSRLRNVKIRSGTELFRNGGGEEKKEPAGRKNRSGTEGVKPESPPQYDYILVDEANRFSSAALEELLGHVSGCGIPCIFSFDPHSLLGTIPAMEDAEAVIGRRETLRLELSGNIRINRPIFSFLRELFHRKDRAGHADYSCIDVLYAGSRREARLLTAHYLAMGYERIDTSAESFRSGKIISQEFDRVLMILDRRFYYDEALHLCADGTKGAAIPPLYEGLSRAREKLCLLIVENRELFSQILAIRTQSTE